MPLDLQPVEDAPAKLDLQPVDAGKLDLQPVGEAPRQTEADDLELEPEENAPRLVPLPADFGEFRPELAGQVHTVPSGNPAWEGMGPLGPANPEELKYLPDVLKIPGALVEATGIPDAVRDMAIDFLHRTGLDPSAMPGRNIFDVQVPPVLSGLLELVGGKTPISEFVRGAEDRAGKFISGFFEPGQAATLPFASLKPVQLMFGAQALESLPESVTEITQAKDAKELGEALTGAGANVTMAAMIAHSLAGPKEAGGAGPTAEAKRIVGGSKFTSEFGGEETKLDLEPATEKGEQHATETRTESESNQPEHTGAAPRSAVPANEAESRGRGSEQANGGDSNAGGGGEPQASRGPQPSPSREENISPLAAVRQTVQTFGPAAGAWHWAVQSLVDEMMGGTKHGVEVFYDPDLTHPVSGRPIEAIEQGGRIRVNAAAFDDMGRVRPALREEIAHQHLATDEGQALLEQFMADHPLTEEHLNALRDAGYDGDLRTLTNEFVAKQARELTPWWRDLVDRVKGWLASKGLATLRPEEAARAILRHFESRADEAMFGDPALAETHYSLREANEGAGEERRRTAITVAPLRVDELGSFGGEFRKKAESTKLAHLSRAVSDVAEAFGIRVASREPMIGGYRMPRGRLTLEVPERVQLETTDMERASTMAGLMGALSPELQHSVMVWQDHEAGDNYMAGVRVKNSRAAEALARDWMDKYRKSGFTFDPATRMFSTVLFGQDTASLERTVNQFADFVERHQNEGNVAQSERPSFGRGRVHWATAGEYSQAVEQARLYAAEAPRQQRQALLDLAQRAEQRIAEHASAGRIARLAERTLGRLPVPAESVQGVIRDLKGRSFEAIRTFGRWLDSRFLARRGYSLTPIGDARGADRAARAMTYDVLDGLHEDGSGQGWYDNRVQHAYDEIERLHPEMKDDPLSKGIFATILAITSQGYTVLQNFEIAEAVYRRWARDGRLPGDMKFAKVNAVINGSLRMVQRLVDERGLKWFVDLMDREVSGGYLRDELDRLPTGVQLKGQVRGSRILGPKIGSFFNNLRGRFDTVTQDLWFTRTMHRYLGETTIPLDSGKAQVALTRFRDAMNEAKRKGGRTYGQDVGKVGKNDDAAIESALHIFNKWGADGYPKYGDGSEVERAARGVKQRVSDMRGAPQNKSHRLFFEDILRRSQTQLHDLGFPLSAADIQAILWYREKSLFAKAGVASDAARPADYLDAAMVLRDRIAKGEGVWRKKDSDVTGAEPHYSLAPQQPSGPAPAGPELGEREMGKKILESARFSDATKAAASNYLYEKRTLANDQAKSDGLLQTVGLEGAMQVFRDPPAGMPEMVRSRLIGSIGKALQEAELAARNAGDADRAQAIAEASGRFLDEAMQRSTELGQGLKGLDMSVMFSPDAVVARTRQQIERAARDAVGRRGPETTTMQTAIEAGRATGIEDVRQDPETNKAARAAVDEAIAKSPETHKELVGEVAGQFATSPGIRRLARAAFGTSLQVADLANRAATIAVGHYQGAEPGRTLAQKLQERLGLTKGKADALAKSLDKEWGAMMAKARARLPQRIANARVTRERAEGNLQSTDSQLEAAIHRQLRTLNLKLGDVLRQESQRQGETQSHVAERIVQASGLTGEAADNLRNVLKQRWDALVTQAQVRALEALQRRNGVSVSRPMRSAFEKLMQLDRLGALTSERFFDVVRTALKLPKLTAEDAAALRAMVTKAQALPEGFMRQREGARVEAFISRLRGDMRWWDVPMGVFYANILSGLTTPAKIVLENTNLLAGHTITALLGRPGELLHPIEFARAVAQAYGRGLYKGGLQAADTLRSGIVSGVWEKPKPTSVMEMQPFGARLEPLNFWKWFTRVISTTHETTFKPAWEVKSTLVARQLARSEGLSGRALQQRVSDVLGNTDSVVAAAKSQALTELGAAADKLDLARRTREIIEQRREQKVPGITAASRDFALRTAYLNEPYGLLGLIANGVRSTLELAREKYPVLGTGVKSQVPFTTIVANILNEKLNWTPVGLGRALLSHRTGELYGREMREGDRAELYAKAIVGTIALGALASLFGDHIHGNGPGTPQRRKQLQAAGWIPHSIEINGRYYSYMNTPAAVGLAVIGNWLDWHRYGKGDEADGATRAAFAAKATANAIVSQGMLDSVKRIFDALGDESTTEGADKMQKALARTATSFVVPNLVQQVDRLWDPTVYDTQGMQALLKGQIPFVRRDNKPVLTVLGDHVQSGPFHYWSNKVSQDELLRVLAEKQAWVPEPNRNQIIGDKTRGEDYFRAMTPDEFYDFIADSGPRIRMRLEKDLDKLELMEPDRAKAHVQKVANEEHAKAKERFKP